jgi:hypothetical protein
MVESKVGGAVTQFAMIFCCLAAVASRPVQCIRRAVIAPQLKQLTRKTVCQT